MNLLENMASAGICLPTNQFWLVESESFLPGSKHLFGTQAKASFEGSAETFISHNDVMLGLYRAKIKIPGSQCVAVARVSGKRKWWFQGKWAGALYFEGEGGRGSEGGITSTRSWTGHIRPNKVQCVKYFCNVFKLLMVYTKSTTDYFVVALKSLIVLPLEFALKKCWNCLVILSFFYSGTRWLKWVQFIFISWLWNKGQTSC